MTDEPMPCEKCGQAHARCSAHTRAGLPCGQPPMRGQRVCKMHGGKSPGAVERAQERQQVAAAEAAIQGLWPGLDAAVPVKDPVASLERLAGALEHLVDDAGRRVTELQHLAGGKDLTQLRAEVTLLERALGHLRAVLVDMARLGIAERHVQLEQERAQLVVAAFMAALDVISLVPADRDLVVRTYLERLGELVPGEVIPS